MKEGVVGEFKRLLPAGRHSSLAAGVSDGMTAYQVMLWSFLEGADYTNLVSTT
jgi:hypothetical protein